MNRKAARGWRVWLGLVSVVLAGACTAGPESVEQQTSAIPVTSTAVPSAMPTPAPLVPTVVPSPGGPVAAVPPPESPSVVRGQSIYDANCTGCHGVAGDGSGLPGAADFTNVEFMRDKTPAEFFQAVRDGIQGTAMPVFGSRFSSMAIWDLVYTVWTFASPQDEVAAGKEKFAATCASCHGTSGDGTGPGCTGSSCHAPADFTAPEFMSGASPRRFFQAIRDGIEGTAMNSWADRYNTDEIWSLVSAAWSFAYEGVTAPQTAAPTVPEPTTSHTGPVSAVPTSVTATPLSPQQTDTPRPAPTAAPTAAPAPSLPAVPDPTVGRQLWPEKPCSSCHGARAQGDIGPRLAGTGLGFDQVLLTVRSGAAPMPAFSEGQVSELELQHIYAWLRSLAPPTPMPVSAPTYPIGALMAMWQQINDMKVKCDFAKDLPERLAGDDAGRLAILKQHASEALQLGQAAIAQANQASADISDAGVRATIGRVIDETNAVVANASAALAQGSFAGAGPHAAEMVRISRLDAWPLATQAVREAGLVGSVRAQVTTQAGAPIAGAFVTVLTAHTPVGVRTDDSGRVTIPNVAAVPALQVKAYAARLVYHEVHVNLYPGTTADVRIALPGPSIGGQTPWVANPSINPSAGPRDGVITLRVSVGDPQGAPNLAEDQIFALQPGLGRAYILRPQGGDRYATQVTLPGLTPGLHSWYFFAVDHQCNTSGVLVAQYSAQ